MANHKISAFLNNCVLNTALPTLLEGIARLSVLEAGGALQHEAVVKNRIFQQYCLLKGVFAKYYCIKPSSALSWQAFNQYLTNPIYTFSAKEIMFAPVLRHFIAEIGALQGYADGLTLLRDVQDDERGGYSLLDHREAWNLLHSQFGIAIKVYTYSHDANKQNVTSDPHNNYILSDEIPIPKAPMGQGPLWEIPKLDLYWKDEHYELAPHELYVGKPSEYEQLPERLREIHTRVTSSIYAHNSNKCLAILLKYVNSTLMKQLTESVAEKQSLKDPAKGSVALVTPTRQDSGASAVKKSTQAVNPELSSESVATPPQNVVSNTARTEVPPTKEHTLLVGPQDVISLSSEAEILLATHKKIGPLTKEETMREEGYSLNAAEYAELGYEFHSDTPEGRQTFSVILLSILSDEPSSQYQSEKVLACMDNLAHEVGKKEPLAAYFLDKLAQTVIDSRAHLEKDTVQQVMIAIEKHNNATRIMNTIERGKHHENHKRLVIDAREIIKKAWRNYKKTKDTIWIEVIEKTEAVAAQPTEVTIRDYKALRARIDGKGHGGKIIAGLMLMLLGIAAIVVALVCIAGSVGLATPAALTTATAGVGSMAAGIGLFKSGREKGFYKKMGLLSAALDTVSVIPHSGKNI